MALSSIRIFAGTLVPIAMCIRFIKMVVSENPPGGAWGATVAHRLLHFQLERRRRRIQTQLNSKPGSLSKIFFFFLALFLFCFVFKYRPIKSMSIYVNIARLTCTDKCLGTLVHRQWTILYGYPRSHSIFQLEFCEQKRAKSDGKPTENEKNQPENIEFLRGVNRCGFWT